MAVSLEGRSPFLSKEMLEFAPRLHDKHKVRKLTTKYLLRSLAKKYLPAEIVGQPKRGFEIPLKQWINTDLKNILNDHILSANAIYPDYIDKKFVLALINNKVKIPQEKRAKILYSVLCLEVWHKQLVRQNTTELSESFAL